MSQLLLLLELLYNTLLSFCNLHLTYNFFFFLFLLVIKWNFYFTLQILPLLNLVSPQIIILLSVIGRYKCY